MATDAELQREATRNSDQERSSLEKFFDNFLQESSIKWILMIGVAIVAGCSLMLVTQKWSGWPITLKYLTILSYTAATYLIAEVCDKRLGLRATSQVLKLLTIVLIPIGFLALATLTRDTASMDISNSMYTLLMMVPATIFMGFAADRIFKHWLQGRQLTFLASYMLLCLAGALPVVNQTWLAVLFSCGFWLVMTLGVLKVNRHIFWLTEEHRWPRIYGFTPIAILGTQLITLYVTKTMGAVPMHWLGFGLVMLAATILMTTRTIANIFRQRTGDLVRPLPMSLITPLFVGLLLIATGMVISLHGFQFVGESTRAVVPTALVATSLLLLVAKDTRHQSFVWAGLILLTIGYQSSPMLVSGLVQSLKATAASTLNEPRLPLAFYGLTYLPLLLILAVAGRWFADRRYVEFSFPMKRYTTCLSVLLVVVALTNLKAAFIVPAISVVTFTVFAVLYRDRGYLQATVASLVVATATSVPFLNAMDLIQCDWQWSFVALATLGLLLSLTRVLDRLALRIPDANREITMTFREANHEARPWIQGVGRALSMLMSSLWLASNFVNQFIENSHAAGAPDWALVAVTFTSLVIWTVQSKHYAAGLWTWIIASAGGWLWLINANLDHTQGLAIIAIVAGTLAMAVYRFISYCNGDISLNRLALGNDQESPLLRNRLMALMLPLADVATVQFVLLVVVYYLPSLLWATATLNISIVPAAWPVIVGLIVVAAMLFRGPLVTIGTALITPVAAGVAVGQILPVFFTYENLPLVYAIASALMLLILDGRVGTVGKAMTGICCLWLYSLVAVGFVSLAPLTMVGAALALASTYGCGKATHTAAVRTIFAAIASGLFIVSLAMLSGFQGFTTELALSPLAFDAAAWMSIGTILAIMLFDHRWNLLDEMISRQWSLGLRVIGLALGSVCFVTSPLAPWLETAVVVAFIAAAINEFRTAIRTQIEAHVFGGFAVLAAVALWVHLQHVMLINPTTLRLLLVIAAAVCFLLAKLWNQHARLHIMVRSFQLFGLVVPFVVTAGSLLTSNHGAVETLSVFGSAMILFIYGRMHQLRWYVVASAVILNLGLGTLWHSMSLDNPQFYLVPVGLTVIGLVELLRRDIHVKAHDPLRYAGALAILVSPCFDILGGSWFPMMSLMILSVLVILLAIGLRLRALIHTGTAFLLMDLAAMVIRSSIDNPGMLWVTGLLIGAAVIALAAVCERNREQLLSHIRVLSAELATWH